MLKIQVALCFGKHTSLDPQRRCDSNASEGTDEYAGLTRWAPQRTQSIADLHMEDLPIPESIFCSQDKN